MAESEAFLDIVGSGEGLSWLDDAACDTMPYNLYFVEAGHIISEDTLNVCRGCPVRRECLLWAYNAEWTAGYFGGMSPSQRRDLSRDEALAILEKEREAGTRGQAMDSPRFSR